MTRPDAVTLSAIALVLALATGCGGSGSSAAPRAAPTPVPTPTAPPNGPAVDDWVTYAHDQARSGFEAQPTGIDRTTVATLRPRWTASLHEPVWSSPIVAGGAVYVATDAGTVASLDAATGAIRWKVHVGPSVRATPALIDGTLFVGVYGTLNGGGPPTGAAFVALDPATGAVRWTAHPPNAGAVGVIRSEPVVLNGVAYEGLAGGDADTGCVNGGIMALDERSGAPVAAFWQTTLLPNGGGGVWSPLSTDGNSIFAGTGNVCDANEASSFGDAVVSLAPSSLATNWLAHAYDPSGYDEDVGGAVNVAGAQAYVATKSGIFYAVDRASGNVAWSRNLHPWIPGGGAIGTATGDGTMILATGGELSDPSANDPPGCTVSAFDLAGNPLYTLSAGYVVRGYAAFVPGIGFIGLDRALVAFDARTGARLWSSGDLGADMYASPAVVPSGVYAATFAGDVTAFSPNGILPSRSRSPRLR
jgi:outer membrane protein assembly factor BamB